MATTDLVTEGQVASLQAAVVDSVNAKVAGPDGVVAIHAPTPSLPGTLVPGHVYLVEASGGATPVVIGTSAPSPATGVSVLWVDTTGGDVTLNLVTGD